MATDKRRMQPCIDPPGGRSLLQLPDETLLGIMRNLDATSLVSLERTAKFFTRKDSVSKLALTEHVARELVIDRCDGDEATARRFRHITWKERLYLEDEAGCGFDREFCTTGGFAASTSPARPEPTVRLAGMGPKLLLSDVSTADQSVLRWRLRVRGNTAVEFGVIPLASHKSNIALHKCLEAGPHAPGHRCMGFSSQITAGSLLPFKAPVMRGTVVDMVVRRGRMEVVLTYPPDAKEITWEGGQPVSKPYRGPSELRFEQDWSPAYDVRLGVTSWAKGCFDVLHTGSNAAGWAAGAVAAPVPVAAPAAPPAKALRASPSSESLPEATGDVGSSSGSLTRASSGTNVAGAADAAVSDAEGACPPGALAAALRPHAS